MQDKLRIRDRRNLDRLKVNYPAIYTRYDSGGEPCDQKIATLTDVSLRGVRLQSSFPVKCGEMLDITLTLGDKLVSFKGKAIHVTASEGQVFDLGISIEEIEDEHRITLVRFLSWIQEQMGC